MTHNRIHPDPVDLRPLLSSIHRELRERWSAIRRLEARLEQYGPEPGRHAEALDVRAELALQRHGLVELEKELADLGWSIELAGNHPRLVRRLGRGLELLSYECSGCREIAPADPRGR